MKNKIIIITAFILTTLSSFAQSDKTKNISGLIQDESQKPIESASISLLKPADSSTIKTITSDKKGNFSFYNVANGKYLINISSVGHSPFYSPAFEISNDKPLVQLGTIALKQETKELKTVSVVGIKPFIEQKADRMIVNVDASPSNAGATVMDVLEKSPGVTVDKDDNISLKGKQNVTIMIDNKPTYMSATQLASYLKSLPASAIDQLEIMTNPSAKYDAAGNSGIINIKTKKNKTKGFNGSLTLTHTQGVYPKPSGSINLNYKTGKANFFFNGGYSHWEGYQNLDINRNYLDSTSKNITSIFTQHNVIKFVNPEFNAKIGMDYYVSNKTTVGFVFSGFHSVENNNSNSTIFLKNADNIVDSIVSSPSTNNSTWKNGSLNLNFRHQFDSLGTELTADIDIIKYVSLSDQYFDNINYDPSMNKKSENILTGNLPSNINIYTFKTDFSHTFKHELKFEAGLKTSYVATDNTANYNNVINNISEVDTTKTNRFLYYENINAAYVNFTKQFKKISVQLGLRAENTNYSGHQLGNKYTVNNNDSSFQKSYVDLFPTAYVSYQANAKNQFVINYGRRIDRPDYQNLNPFLFFLDEYTYQAGNPYLQPQFSDNIELSHTYNNWLTTTLNYSHTDNFFAETFEQQGHATIVRNGNIGVRKNMGVAVSAQIPVRKWWTSIWYVNYTYNKFTGMLYGSDINISSPTVLFNINNQFKFNNGWGAELSGFYRSKGVEGQILLQPFGQMSAAVSKQILKEKGSLKLGIRDAFRTQIIKGTIDFQQTDASFKNSRDSRQVSLTFTYRFGKPIKGVQPHRNTGGANDESNRVKTGGNN
jgi:iron complex outermembrane recepter protein